MALRVGISVPKPAKYYSTEMFLGAGTVLLGDELIKRAMPYITQYIPLTGDAGTVASIALKSLLGFGMFYGGKRTTGTLSDVLYGMSFGSAVSVVKDLVSFAMSKLPATTFAAQAVRVVPPPAIAPAPVVAPTAPVF